MRREIYFKNFKLPRGGCYWWHLVLTAHGHAYYVHTSGKVAVRYSTGVVRMLKERMVKGLKCVKIFNRNVSVKNLVAREKLVRFNSKIHIAVCKDGNENNCDIKNIEIFLKTGEKVK